MSGAWVIILRYSVISAQNVENRHCLRAVLNARAADTVKILNIGTCMSEQTV